MAWRKLDPRTLATLTDKSLKSIQFSGKMPTVFVTGDAHRNPPFRWIDSCRSDTLKRHFEDLVNQGQLCVHVEQYKNQIKTDSVPKSLRKLIGMQRIFGWELEVYRYFQEVMRECSPNGRGLLELDDRKVPNSYLIKSLEDVHRNICEADKRLKDIGYPTTLKGKMEAHGEYLKYYKHLRDESRPKSIVGKLTTGWGAKPTKPSKNYLTFLQEYSTAANKLRTSPSVHTAIARKIQSTINVHSGCTHLITCGSKHLLCEHPLFKFILSPKGGGVVDVDEGKVPVPST